MILIFAFLDFLGESCYNSCIFVSWFFLSLYNNFMALSSSILRLRPWGQGPSTSIQRPKHGFYRAKSKVAHLSLCRPPSDACKRKNLPPLEKMVRQKKKNQKNTWLIDFMSFHMSNTSYILHVMSLHFIS